MASATRTAKGFDLCCPMCGDAEATVKMDLNNLKSCECNACGEEFSPADAVAKLTEQLNRWQAVARWIDMAADAMESE